MLVSDTNGTKYSEPDISEQEGAGHLIRGFVELALFFDPELGLNNDV